MFSCPLAKSDLSQLPKNSLAAVKVIISERLRRLSFPKLIARCWDLEAVC